MEMKEIFAIIIGFIILVISLRIIGFLFKMTGGILSFPYKLIFGDTAKSSPEIEEATNLKHKIQDLEEKLATSLAEASDLKDRISTLEEELYETYSKLNYVNKPEEKIIHIYESGSNSYTDSTGFEHLKYCIKCTKFMLHSKHNGETYCSAHQVSVNTEPFRTYHLSTQPNYCPLFYPTSAD